MTITKSTHGKLCYVHAKTSPQLLEDRDKLGTLFILPGELFLPGRDRRRYYPHVLGSGRTENKKDRLVLFLISELMDNRTEDHFTNDLEYLRTAPFL